MLHRPSTDGIYVHTAIQQGMVIKQYLIFHEFSSNYKNFIWDLHEQLTTNQNAISDARKDKMWTKTRVGWPHGIDRADNKPLDDTG